MEFDGEGCAKIIVFTVIVIVCGFGAWLLGLGFWGGFFLILVLSVVGFSGFKNK